MTVNTLARLGQAYGIFPRYHDVWGTLHDVSEATTRALLDAMGVGVASDEAVETALVAREAVEWRRRLAPFTVVRDDVPSSRIRLHVPASVPIERMHAGFVDEAGVRHSRSILATTRVDARVIDGESWHALDVEVAVALPAGYYAVVLGTGDDDVARSQLAVVPRRCYRQSALRAPAWGIAVQLYGVRSRRDWGIGDFTDLAQIVSRLGERGVGIVGVNPLHALFPHNPAHISPYSPSSRLFVNTLYVDVMAVADFADCAPARALVESPEFRARIARLRDSALVDYPGVARAKREVLELLYAAFRERHGGGRTRRARSFRAFKHERGEALTRHALFEAIQEHCFAQDSAIWGWPAWPERFRNPRSPAVAQFAETHAERVDFYAYLQWQADLQRTMLARQARDAGLAVGMYNDLAVSIDRGGAESWAYQDLYALGASVGAPPDAFNPAGQDWGLPPIVPSRLRDAGYAPFLAILRANMRHAGALRIDHVMALMRLFWIPPGGKPGDGAYVHYPFDDLVGLLALESHRNHCLVIGEDLGTVPDEVRRTLAEADVLSYRVLWFERDPAGGFKPPGAYPEAALATPSTHDLPTIAGWWEGHDIEVRSRLGLISSDEDRRRLQNERADEKRRLLRALHDAGFLSQVTDVEGEAGSGRLTPALMEAIAAYLAATPCVLDVLQLEDALLVRDQANLPGTVDAHPNWRRKLPLGIEDALTTETFRSLSAVMARARPAPRRSPE